MERLEKEKQAEIRSYKGLMVQEKMISNKQIASGSKTVQELEEDFMWEKTAMPCLRVLWNASVKDRASVRMLLFMINSYLWFPYLCSCGVTAMICALIVVAIMID
jgi:hypothetical protein